MKHPFIIALTTAAIAGCTTTPHRRSPLRQHKIRVQLVKASLHPRQPPNVSEGNGRKVPASK